MEEIKKTYTFSFEKLRVWQDARVLVKMIYELTNKFPDIERFGLINQMRRAAVSVVSNIAEGSSKDSGKDKASFSRTAYGSLMELLNQLIISSDLDWSGDEAFAAIRDQIEKVANKLNALRESQLKMK